MQNQEIWLTDYRFLNDSKEFLIGGDVLEGGLRLLNFSREKAEFRELAQDDEISVAKFDLLIQNLIVNSRAIFQNIFRGPYFPYIMSLSEIKDSLGQWRAYGNGEICIEFDSDHLLSAIGGDRLRRVQYVGSGFQIPGLTDPLRTVVARAIETYRTKRIVEGETIQDGWQDMSDSFKKCWWALDFKHESFQEECEQRIIIEVAARIKEGPQIFFDRGRYPVPRVKVSLAEHAREIPNLITGVMFGPGSDKRLAASSIDALNRSYGTRIIPEFSLSPYRSGR